MAGGGGDSGVSLYNPKGLELKKQGNELYFLRTKGAFMDCDQLDTVYYGKWCFGIEHLLADEGIGELPSFRFLICADNAGMSALEVATPLGVYRNIGCIDHPLAVYNSSSHEWSFYSGDELGGIRKKPYPLIIKRIASSGDWYLLPVIDTLFPHNAISVSAGAIQYDGIDYCVDEKQNHIINAQEYEVTATGSWTVTQQHATVFIQGDPENLSTVDECYVRYGATPTSHPETQQEVIDWWGKTLIFIGDSEDPLYLFWEHTGGEISAYQRQAHHGWYKWIEGNTVTWDSAGWTGSTERAEIAQKLLIYSDPSDEDVVTIREPEGVIDFALVEDIDYITRIAAFGNYIVCLDPDAADKIKVIWWQRPPKAFDWELQYNWGNYGSAEYEFVNPQSVSFDGVYIYIVDEDDSGNYFVKKYKKDGTYISRRQISRPGLDICLLK